MDNKNASVIKKALSLALAVATAFTMVACRSQTTHEPPSITQAPDTTVSENAVNENTTIATTEATIVTTTETTTETTTTESTTTEATTTTTPTTEKEVTTKKEGYNNLTEALIDLYNLPKDVRIDSRYTTSVPRGEYGETDHIEVHIKIKYSDGKVEELCYFLLEKKYENLVWLRDYQYQQPIIKALITHLEREKYVADLNNQYKETLNQLVDIPKNSRYLDFRVNKINGRKGIYLETKEIGGIEHVVISIWSNDPKSSREINLGSFHLEKDLYSEELLTEDRETRELTLEAKDIITKAMKEELARRKEAEENE